MSAKQSVFKVLAEYLDSDDEEQDGRRGDVPKVRTIEKTQTFKSSTKALTSRPNKQPKKTNVDECVSILTYNVLADHLCKPAWFKYRSKAELDWRERREVIKRTILEANADVVCLQEVQMFVGPEHVRGNDHHLSWFDGWLRQEGGYTGCSGARSNANGKPEQGLQIGNLLYWKASKFEPLLVESSVSLLQTIAGSLKGDKDMRSIFSGSNARGTTASVAALRCLASDRVLAIATTHLPAPRSDGDGGSKLEQLLHAYALVQEVSSFVKRVKDGVDAVLISGDLNAMPGSDVLELLESGRLSRQRVLRSLRAGGRHRAPFVNEERLEAPLIKLRGTTDTGRSEKSGDQFTYMTNLVSLGGSSPSFTNATDTFRGWLDHMYCAATPGAITGCETKDPSVGLASDCMLPDPKNGFGSDHLPLLCSLNLSGRATTGHHIEDFFVQARALTEEDKADDLDKLDYLLVHDDDTLAMACLELGLSSAEDSEDVYFVDLQASNLSRNGQLSLLVIKRVDVSKAITFRPVLFDAVALGWKRMGLTAPVKDLLENDCKVKVGFDLRLDSDLLFHQLNCCLRNALDVQILNQGIRLNRGEELKERTQSWIPHVQTLSKMARSYLESAEIGRISRPPPFTKGSTSGWTNRPLFPSALDYAASQVTLLEEMFNRMRESQRISEDILAMIELHSRRAVEDFRSRDQPVLPERDRDVLLLELSIRLPWTSPNHSYGTRWKAVRLFA